VQISAWKIFVVSELHGIGGGREGEGSDTAVKKCYNWRGRRCILGRPASVVDADGVRVDVRRLGFVPGAKA
jgi:hypothetical protein